MKIAKTVLLTSMQGLLKVLDCTLEECQSAIKKGYRKFRIVKDGKIRLIEEPNPELKIILQNLLKFLRQYLPSPDYCMAGYEGQNNIKNAEKHIKKREVITMDISHYFPNTQAKYVKAFFEKLGMSGEVLDLIVDLTTYNGHLPTGAPTSTFLSFWVHKDIFDSIYNKMQELETDMTIYVDDITLSTHKHIGNWVIGYINNALKTHGLFLKKSKTKRYSYRNAVVTGVYIAQDGKLSTPYKMGYSVVKTLQDKDIKQMSIKELQKFIAKISYMQQIDPKCFKISRFKAIKQLKRLIKAQNK